ncbi:2,3-bisphosphoglycerate-dependent phosphoglycerate mutase [Ensifer canadensis]
MTGTLVLVRHGQSEWNLKNLFTGWRDPDLTELGVEEAKTGGKALAEQRHQVRHRLHLVAAPARQQHLPVRARCRRSVGRSKPIRDQALNERDYGDLSGLNKDDAREKWGEEQVHIWRRSYDIAPPGGESLRDTGARVWPYYLHGYPAARAAPARRCSSPHMATPCARSSWCSTGLTKEEILKLNLATGVPIVYKLNADSTVASKEVLGDMSAAH